jgi:hypothetical protein
MTDNGSSQKIKKTHNKALQPIANALAELKRYAL